MKKTLRKTPDSHGAQLEGRGGISRPLPQWMPLWGDTSIFLSLVCIIMASQRALLVVYLVSLVYVRSAKSLGRNEVVLGEGGTPTLPRPGSFLLFTWSGVAPPQPPRGAWQVKQYFIWSIMKKERKETASLSADCLFNQLHKKCTEKIIRTILYRYMWPALLSKLLSNEETLKELCTITFSVMIWN